MASGQDGGRHAARRAVEAGRARHVAGDGAGAEAAYRQALAIDPGAADAWHGLGALAHARGHHVEAIALVRRALQARPRTGHYHLVLGACLLALGQAEAARAALTLAATLAPDDWRAHAALGRVLARLGRSGEARASLERAASLAPGSAEVGHALAVLDLATGAPDAAVGRFASLAASAGRDAVSLANWGAALQAAGRFDEAETVLGDALAGAPDSVEALSNRGLARLGVGRLDAALGDLRRAHGLAPADRAVMRNLASAHYERDERGAARALLGRVLSADPADRDARLNLGTLDLAEGRLAEGWRGYAARPGRPGWRGEALDGRTLRVEAEQGLGDTVMFLRYVPLAAARVGETVTLALPAALHRLARRVRGLDGVARIVALEDAPDVMTAPGAAGEARVRLGDLAALLSPDIAGIPPPAPIVPEPDLVRTWRARLAGDARIAGRPVIGLAWSGNPRYRQDRRRSIPPERLAPLLAGTAAAFVSVQPGAGLDGAPSLLAPGADLAETASLLACLDAVVTADTLIVHLAGSLGVATVLLDRVGGDWRWFRDRSDSPWYPSLRIVRDDIAHDPERAWFDAVERAGAVLHDLPSLSGPGRA